MSAVAIPFDPALGLGPRPAPYTWHSPLESSASPESIIHSDFAASSLNPGSDPSLTPPSVTSSLTSSPPRISFTPEQRELKRQQDRARRDSRLASRLRRVSSQTSYMDSPSMSPITTVTSSMEFPAYSAATAPVSLLTEPAGPMSTPYMPSYTPPIHDPSQAQMFPTAYTQPMQQSYGMPIEYQPSPYPSASYSRSSPMSVGPDGGMMYQVPAVMAPGSASSQASASPEGGHVRVVQSRPKPRCWEHGCNGRQFSTFSNLLRHQREKSGQASKASCPNCGAEFTRTTARNGHLLHDKCKQRRNS